MESFLKLTESFNEIVKREGGTKYHRSPHGFIVVLPLLHKNRWRYKKKLGTVLIFCYHSEGKDTKYFRIRKGK